MDAHDLYGLPLDRFVPERTALARELRKAGERDQAEAISALRKPSVAAWAVNQLVRTQSRALAALFDAGDAVQSAQADLIAGRGDSTVLRQALSRERQSVAELVAVARGLLTSDGDELSPATLERVSETLDAAALEDEARAEIRDGCLHRELRRVGLGSGPPAEPPPAKAKANAPESKTGAAKPKPSARRKNADASERRKEVSALRRAEADARRASERAARELKSARTTRDSAAQALDLAEKALTAAAERARAANAAHRKAERNLRSHR